MTIKDAVAMKGVFSLAAEKELRTTATYEALTPEERLEWIEEESSSAAEALYALLVERLSEF